MSSAARSRQAPILPCYSLRAEVLFDVRSCAITVCCPHHCQELHVEFDEYNFVRRRPTSVDSFGLRVMYSVEVELVSGPAGLEDTMFGTL